jgi:hypothetical protein
MARAIATIEGCETIEGVAVVRFSVTCFPEAGDTFEIQTHHLEYIMTGAETQSQLNNNIQAEGIAQMALIGINLTGNKFI